MIEPVDVGIEVSLQVLEADSMIHAVNAPLGIAPKTFDIVGVSPASDVLLGTVDNGFVGIPQAGQPVVSSHARQCKWLRCRGERASGP